MGGISLPVFRTGPSHIGRYFFHDCDRFLRFSATRSDQCKAQGVPKVGFDTSPIMRAILEHGYEWEEQVVRRLGSAVAIAPDVGSGTIKLHERQFTWEQTLDLLRTAEPGTYIYQATLRPPTRFYSDHAIDPALVSFGENHPDLIEVFAYEGGRRLFRVIDVKRGTTLRSTHRVQILLYALQLRAIIEEHGIADADADLRTGAVWLGGEEVATPCDLDAVRPHLDAFLRHDLTRILTAPASDVDWHVHFRCEWCGYFQEYCQKEMRKNDDVSRLPHLTVSGKRHLVHEAGVRTVPELEAFLGRPDADAVLARCASLAGRRHHLRTQVAAFKSGKPQVSRAGAPALPIGENLGLFLTMQQEPLGKHIYLSGLFVQARADICTAVLGAASGKLEPEVWVAASGGEAELADVRARFVERLFDVLRRVHDYNDGREWKEQLSVQAYVHSEHERSLLVELLMRALRDPHLAERAMTLLFYFHCPELMLAGDHPRDDAVQYPVVVMLSVLGRLLALPVDVSYTLPESLTAVGSTFNYERKDYFHFPLGHGLRPDPIYLAWNRGKSENVDRLRQQARMHLWAVRSLLSRVRELTKAHLFAWPPKFILPMAAGVRDPHLSRMIFFARYESLLRCLQVRESRAEAREVQVTSGGVVQLRADDAATFEVVEDAGADLSDDFPRYLLVRDTDAGRRGQLEFSDYHYRSKMFAKLHPHRAIAKVIGRRTDPLGLPVEVDVEANFDGGPPRKNERFLLYERYTDFTTEKVVSFLRDLDDAAGGVGLFVQLIRNPSTAASRAPLPKAVERGAADAEAVLGLMPSQVEAYRRVRGRRVVAVWGPPGTGKTHFLASMILGLAAAHRAAGRPFRVLVTSFTHAAIENLLRSVADRSGELELDVDDVAVGKAGGWRSPGTHPGDNVPSGGISGWLAHHPLAVVGATVYACVKPGDRDVRYDLVIVDEASQVRVPESSIPVTLVGNGGRLVLAGDHRQLPPIVAGEYPDPEEGEPLLHRSVFELLLPAEDPLGAEASGCGNGEGVVCQLLENWRMNDVLTSYAAALIYGPRYTCATATVAGRRMRLGKGSFPSELVAACLTPEQPLVIVVLDGCPPARENEPEASLVADLVETLRERLLNAKGRPYGRDEDFFDDGVFVVSPHHCQIQLIRRELARRRAWSRPPFVDTVDKMQGQEADVVLVSYGVSDAEFALQEAEFIYGLNRLNVAITRAKSKCIVCLPAALLEASPEVLDVDAASEGLAYMRRLCSAVEVGGERLTFRLGDSVSATVLRTGSLCVTSA